MIPSAAIAAVLLAGSPAGRAAAPLPSPAGMAAVGPGTYRPVFPPSPEEEEIQVPRFFLDRLPVTNAAFLDFVKRKPGWQRGRISRLFADPGYLAHWAGATELGPGARPDQPVVRVSWFAAAAYCEDRGARLPTDVEWELAAQASEREMDGRKDPVFLQRILAWYSKPTPEVLPRVGTQPANYWGVQDLHGLVWEWILDFNGTLVAVDSRGSGGDDPDTIRFCGGGAFAAAEKDDYASFMRIAFRSSLQADFTTGNLGFRCARSAAPEEPGP